MTTTGVKTILYPVTDLDRAKAVFTALLGQAPTSDAPYYVGYDVAGQQIGLVPNGQSQGLSGPVGHYHVDDITGTIQALVAAGAQSLSDPRDVGGGRLVASVKDTDGNVIGLIQDTRQA